MSLTLYDLLTNAVKPKDMHLTKQKFGQIMHDPEATEEQIEEALEMLETAGGYENLGDE